MSHVARPAARLAFALAALFLLMGLGGCQSAYYGAWEKLGYQKRDILVERVEKARDSQDKAKTQFKDALEQFRSVVQVNGGELQAKYDTLKAKFDQSQALAKDVHTRVDAVRSVSSALFKEWENELAEYKSADLRRTSEQTLRETQRRYEQLIAAMERAEKKMDPVLDAFHDQVLFLKHNLNARAIASLQGVSTQLETDINRLIDDMNHSIDEANSFIKDMNASGK
ncbi:MAG: DUF2959 domain-containing protein [Planctomycetota bacterium]|nr:DUF2959 domain-containing protein [Planctomycetota bacterium]